LGNVTRLALISLFISALTMPASAFASTSSSFASQSIFQLVMDHVSLFFFGSQGGIRLNNYSENGDNEDNNNWANENRGDCPSQDSYHIWQDWYSK
jgi:hypothetical protein